MTMPSSKTPRRSLYGGSSRSKGRGANATSSGFLGSPKGIAAIAGVVVAIGGIGWGVVGRSTPAGAESTLPKELQVDALKAGIDDPGKLRETIRGAFQREDLTDEQRRELRGNMRQMFRSAMTERVDAYFDAPEDQKTAILDEQIDQFAAQMAEWRQRREGREQRARDGDRGGNRSATQEQRKNRSESRDPDQAARGMAYTSAIRARMSERGIQMPGGGGRGGGGGGRGFGGFGRRGP